MNKLLLESLVSSGTARLAVLPVTAVSGALTSFLVIQYAGAGAFGYVSLIGTLFLLFPFADLGLGAAVVNAFAGHDGSESSKRAVSVLTRAAFIALLVSGAGLILIIALAAYLGIAADLLGIRADDVAGANLAIFIAVVPFAVSLPFGIGQRVLLGLGKNHVANYCAISGPIASVGATALMIAFEISPIYLSSAMPLGVLVTSAVTFIAARRQTNWQWRDFYSVREGEFSRLPLWNAALPMMVMSLAVPVGLQSGRLILSHVGDAESLAEFSLGAQFYLPAFSLAATAGAALWPIYARNRSNNASSWHQGLKVMSLLGLILAVCFWLLIGPVATLTSLGEIDISALTAVSFALLLIIMSIHQASATLLTTPRMLAFQAICASLMACLAIGLGILFVPVMGAAGIPMANSVAVAAAQLVPGIMMARKVVGGK